jgi:photosystem II stability/assembly factor-like uncharacterized protein
MKNFFAFIFLALQTFAAFSQTANKQTKITSATLGMMEARHIGPAVMGGRITSIDAINNNPRIMYVGTADGGVWKSLTGGTVWKPMFDKYTQSIGAIAIDQNHPDTVWVGTGESNMRNSVSVGTGMYRSTDGGENWTKVGLDSTEHISRIVIDPRNSNVVYVAAPGPLWGDSKHRGLYKTTDGGATWEKILYTDEKTGCAEIIMNPKNPDVLYASMWQFRRNPYSFSSGGKGSALYKSTDAGKTWKKIQNGFPEGDIGRIALNIAPSEPDKLFAIIESKNTGLYLTDNGGELWRQQSSTSNVNARPFYFSVIKVDPKDAKRVYRPAFSFSISSDGGQSFTEASQAGGWVHSDMHALWINPENTSQMYLATDGGLYMSLDRGNNWTFLNNLPLSQFYHVQLDDEIPYNVYGGLQDNGSWMGPSQSINGIENRDWENVGGGDGFWVQPDRTDKNIIYSESQGGEAQRYNRKINESASIKPQPLTGEKKLRFNWNTPIYTSPTNPKTLYMSAQYLYRSYDQGRTWDRISPDLTTNDPVKQNQEESGGVTSDNSSAENHCTIFTICESPLDEKLIWVGTDDGNLQVTTDGGKAWTKVNTNIPVSEMPAQSWVSSIEASRYDKNTVYATFDNHTYGDMHSYAFKSTDLGKTWKALATADLKGYAHKIKEDIVNKDLLFLGTEMGLFMSFDGGTSWVAFTSKMPPVAVRDIQIHPKTQDLVLATHGRGIMIVDDISPLRKLTPEIINADAALLPTRPVPVTNGHFGAGFPGAGGYVGSNAPEEAVILYYLKDRVTSGDVRIEIYDKKGTKLESLPGTRRKGINKLTWNMRMHPPRAATGVRVDYAGFVSPLVEKGMYTVKLLVGDKKYDGTIELIDDPLLTHNTEDMALQRTTSMKLYSMVEDMAFFTARVTALRDTLGRLDSMVTDKKLKKQITVAHDSLDSIRKRLIATKGGTAITGEERIRERLSELFANVVGYLGKPTDLQLERMHSLEKELADEKKKADELWSKNIASINAALSVKSVGEKPTVQLTPPLKWLSKEEFDKTDTRK